ncbi:MAG: zinc ABC transporter substrate-binding protein [Desulfarculus sp.]|nr:zinc ABC transporter substrate-binding protein [Desulfarculus sp.]
MRSWFVAVLCWLGLAAPTLAVASEPGLAAGVPPVAWLAGRVAGQAVPSLSGPGQDPHTFEPSPKQAAQVATAKVYFSLDLPFEQKLLPKIAAANPGLKVVDLADGLDLLPGEGQQPAGDKPAHGHGKVAPPPGPAKAGHGHGHDHGHGEGELDPHVWMSPRLCQDLARTMARELSALWPEKAVAIQANLAALLAELRDIDQELVARLAPFAGREFMVYHPAFGYFARDYGLRQVAVETGGKEPGPRNLARLIGQARARGVKVIFVQPQFPQKSAQQVAREIGGVVEPLDDLSPDPPQNWRRMAESLARGLAGGN